jgi:hypothetical protein
MNMDRIGFIGIKVALVKKDESLIDLIMKGRSLPETQRPAIAEMLRYNIVTVRQMSELTGTSLSTVTNKIRPSFKNNEISTELDHTYCFPSIGDSGPKFVVRNEKFHAFIVSALKDSK